jgi:UDP-N-acetylmuramyl pentapeptide phosphotransferase/UDP-N-acetylglucosamine-1-phosphate transferase
MTLAFFLGAFGLSAVLHVLAVKLFPRLGLLDFPERYGLARASLPYPIGLVFAVLACVTLALFGSALNVPVHVLCATMAVLALLCFVDDRWPLPVTVRFGVQLLLAFILFAEGTRIYTVQNPLSFLVGGPIISLDHLTFNTSLFGSLPFWSGIVTIGWLLFTMNAMNWFDGISGQVSVLSLIAFLTLGLLALLPQVNQGNVAMLSLILAGLAAGSAIVTFPHPKAILGDTGAMTMGLLIGMLAMAAGGKVATAFLVLGVPLIDSLFVIVRRVMKGASPWKGNARDEHLHHRLLLKGWSERQIVVLTAVLGMAFGGSALVLNTLGKLIAFLMLAVDSKWWFHP